MDGKADGRIRRPLSDSSETTGLHLISKEILTKRGLLSCLDYYLN